MGLRMDTNVPALKSARSIDGSTRALRRRLVRLSGGLRINCAAEDASGLAFGEGFRTEVQRGQMSRRYARDGIRQARNADGTAGETTNVRRRAHQAANATPGTANRAALNTEAQEFIAWLEAITLDMPLHGAPVTTGEQSIALQTGSPDCPTPRVALAGTVSTIRLIDVAKASVSRLRNDHGVYMNRLEFTVDALAIPEDNTVYSRSFTRVLGFARETILLASNQLLVIAGIVNVALKPALERLSPPRSPGLRLETPVGKPPRPAPVCAVARSEGRRHKIAEIRRKSWSCQGSARDGFLWMPPRRQPAGTFA